MAFDVPDVPDYVLGCQPDLARLQDLPPGFERVRSLDVCMSASSSNASRASVFQVIRFCENLFVEISCQRVRKSHDRL